MNLEAYNNIRKKLMHVPWEKISEEEQLEACRVIESERLICEALLIRLRKHIRKEWDEQRKNGKQRR